MKNAMEFKDGYVHVPILPDGIYELHSTDSNSDVYKHYYGIAVAKLLEIGKKKNPGLTKDMVDAFLVRRFVMNEKPKEDNSLLPIKTKRDLTRSELIDFVNLCCSFAGTKCGKVLPLLTEG